MKKEAIIEAIGVLGIILYIMSNWIEPKLVLLIAGCILWGIEATYKLTKWKSISMYTKIINIIILLLMITNLALHIL